MRFCLLGLFFSVFTLFAAQAQDSDQAKLDEIAADMKRVTEAIIDGSMSIEEASKLLEELADLDIKIRTGIDIAAPKTDEPESEPPVFAADLGLDPNMGSVVPAGSLVRVENVPLDFEGKVWLRPEKGPDQEIGGQPDFDRLEIDPGSGASAWLIRLPFDVQGAAYLDFEGLAHPAVAFEVTGAEPLSGSIGDRLAILDYLLRLRLSRLGWTQEKAVAVFQKEPAMLPVEVSQLAMYYFAMFSDENPINLVSLLEIERELSPQPERFDQDLARLFDLHFPAALLRDRGDMNLQSPVVQHASLRSVSKARVWRASTGPEKISFERLLEMLKDRDLKETDKKGYDAVGSSISATGAGAIAGGGIGSLVSDVLFSAVSSKLRDELHNLPKHLEISADLERGGQRKINDNSCMPLVVKVTAYSDPKIDLIYSQGGAGAELMAKIIVPLVELALNHPKLKGTLKKRLTSARANQLLNAADGFEKKVGNPYGRLEQATKVQLLNKAIKEALLELEKSGGPAFEIRRTPARVWGPITLTPEQISKHVELQTHRGPVRIGKDGCITACWHGNDEAFSVSATLRVNKGSAFGYGYRVAPSLARGQFAPATGRINLEQTTVAPGGGMSVALEMDNALPGTVKFGVIGGKGSIGPVVGQTGTFIAPETIEGCSQQITVTAQLEQDPDSMCAPAPVFTRTIDVRDPDARVLLPQELVCQGAETLPFSVGSPSGEAACSVAGAGSVSGSGSAFTYTCEPGRKAASVRCMDAKGGNSKSCAPVMNIRYVKQPGIAAAAYVAAGASNDPNWQPSFSAKQLLKPRLRVLADTEPPRPDELMMPGGDRLAAEYREPTAETAEHFESVVAPVRAEEISLSRSAQRRNANWHHSEQSSSTLTANFFNTDTPGLSVRASIKEDIQTFESNDDAKRATDIPNSEVDFVAFIPIDDGGPEINAVAMLNGEVSGRAGSILVMGYADDPVGLSLLPLTTAVRIIPSTQDGDREARFENRVLGGLALAPAAPHLGRKRGLSTFVIPEAPVGTPRGILVQVEGNSGPQNVTKRQPGVLRNSPALLGRGTMITVEARNSINLEIELLGVFRSE
ncbi:hypothetical protein [uncultured Roseibium sp.]|uniref:hypothetical protein n=1 Tax=uncultured Roseibium sp. TaxID=1936171 RepID=UPI0026139703|nr:hypothetical protein [uncultured Roseibium sp.]